MLANIVDRTLEALVVPSFTRIGYEVRRRLFDWEPLDRFRIEGRVVAVTGATSGLGELAAITLARLGARVLILGRSGGKLRATEERIRREVGEDVGAFRVDMSDIAAVRAVAAEIRERESRLDVVIHNAGALLTKRRTSVDGNEMTFATMVLGPFVLTRELLPMLAESDDGRVITVTSGGMYTQALHLDDLQMTREPYRGTVAYARAKRAQVVLTRLWASHHRTTSVVFHAMHPGWADTPGLEASLPRFRTLIEPVIRTPEQGADTIVWLVAAEEPRRSNGLLWLDRRPRPFDRLPGTTVSVEQAIRLWDAFERLT